MIEISNKYKKDIQGEDEREQQKQPRNKTEQRLWVELADFPSGHTKLSTKINGKHFVGFVKEYEDKRRDGTPYTKKLACLRPCDYDGCYICKGSGGSFEINF